MLPVVDIDSLLPKLTRVGGTPLDQSDSEKLRVFFSQFGNESDAELERKRGVMRERLRLPRWLTDPDDGVPGDDGVLTKFHTFPRITWENPHLDQAKFDILTAIIQDRTCAKLQPPAPSPQGPAPSVWTRYVAFTGGTGRALVWPFGLLSAAVAIWGVLKALGLA